jgi:hypothetical protein
VTVPEAVKIALVKGVPATEPLARPVNTKRIGLEWAAAARNDAVKKTIESAVLVAVAGP